MRDMGMEGGPRGRRVHGRGGHPRGRRMRRGDIRTAVLAVLAEGPGHGYDVMQRLEDKTEGGWRPSPGSVYPTLQLLADEGLALSVDQDGKRVYELTDSGRAEMQRRIEEAGGTPWELDSRADASFGQLRDNMRQLHMAARQVAVIGRPEVVERAVAIVRDARKQLYGLLAED
jgi:DNA-binding PadR family transcriptional regulator